MVFVADLDGAIVRSSDVLAQKLGSGPGAAISLLDLAHLDDRDSLKAAWTTLTSDSAGGLSTFECRLRLPDGSHRAFLFKVRRTSSGSEVCGSLKEKDVDASDQGRSRRLLRAITQNLEIILWEVDREGLFTYHSGKGLAAAGLAEGQFLGQNVFELYASTPDGLVPLRRALAGEGSRSANESHGVSWEHWQIPIRDDHGTVVGVAGVSTNVTDSKRTERELQARLDLIERQNQAIQAMSIPIIQVWDSVLTVPLVGMVDSMRAAELMEKLLGEVVRTRAGFAILDLTGVEAMDTSTASHMLRLISSLRLLGAQGILTGIRPSIAHTMVGLGIEMGGVRTLANLREGLRFCMEQMDDAPSTGRHAATRRGE